MLERDTPPEHGVWICYLHRDDVKEILQIRPRYKHTHSLREKL